MAPQIKSLRTFIGAKDFETSVNFYKAIGFTESAISPGFSRFFVGELSFYLQDAYIKAWLENTMLFIEVPDALACYDWLVTLQLTARFPGVKVLPVKQEQWGAECFVIDPAGALLHFGMFY